ncbi:MAG: MFS transporter [Anaerolineaceae bacterium]|nr:MFS transporter [Anaerolineaceae bacterium]
MSYILSLYRARHHPLLLSLYVPAFLFWFAQSLLTPVLPLYAAGFEISYGLIGLLLAGDGIGMLLGDVPGGLLLRRFGSRRMMIVGITGAALATVALFWASSVPEALFYRVVSGFCVALYGVSRHDYISSSVGVGSRGRAISLLGGMYRTGKFVGPAIGATIAAAFGLRTSFLAAGLVAGIALVVVIFYMPHTPIPPKAPTSSRMQLVTTFKTHFHVFSTAGIGQIFVQMLRSGTLVIVPLYADRVLGLDVQTIGFIMSLGAALDMLMFLPAGIVMDRLGRKFAVVPSFVIQAAGMALMPFTTGFGGLVFASALIGFANGLSSGTMMTIGSDLAPTDSRGEFLGIWRLIGDIGSSGGPLAVGAIAGVLTLPASALVMTGTGILAASIFAFRVPETLKRPPANPASF